MKKLTLLARIIDQSVKGIETTTDTILGDKYTTVLRSATHTPGEDFPDTPEWKRAIDAYFYERPKGLFEEKEIIGFIYGDDVTVAIKDHHVAYIVTNEGDTVKRVYGMYVKY